MTPGPERGATNRRVGPGMKIGAVAALVAAGIVVLVRLNPSQASVSTISNPTELLDDPAFNAAESTSPWRPVPGSGAGVYRVERGGGATRGVVHGTIRQEVPLTPVDGRSYRLAVHLRSTNGPASGVLRLQTACATGQERAESRFTAGAAWADVAVTLVPRNGGACSLRVEVATNDQGTVELDRASLVDAVLRNASFEAGAADWVIGEGGSSTTVTARAVANAFDGGAVGVLRTGSSAGSIEQDVVLDRSSEAVLARAGVMVRSVGERTPVTLRVWAPCATSFVETKATVGTTWTALSADESRIRPTSPGAIPPDPPGLIRPDGPACALRVEVRAGPGANVELDSADVVLRSYNPTKGSPLYRHNLRASTAVLDSVPGGSPASTIASRDAGRKPGS